jgi:hypothetical protein
MAAAGAGPIFAGRRCGHGRDGGRRGGLLLLG